MNSENWPDYNLLGGQGDFERIENALLLLVGHGQLVAGHNLCPRSGQFFSH